LREAKKKRPASAGLSLAASGIRRTASIS